MSLTSSLKSLATRFIQLRENDDSLVSLCLFFLAYGVMLGNGLIIGQTVFASVVPPLVSSLYIRVSCLVVLAIREVVFGRWCKRTLAGFILCLLMAYSAYLAVFKAVFYTCFFVFAARNIPFRKIALFTIVELGAILVVTISCALVGAIPDSLMNRGEEVRHHLGFSHPNVCQSLVFFFMCLWVYLRGERYCIIDAIAILVVSLLVFQLTDSRTSIMMTVILVIGALAVKYLPKTWVDSPFSKGLLIGFPAVCAVVSFALAACYDPSVEWMKALNTWFSGRLMFGHEALGDYGVLHIGQQVGYSKSTAYSVAAGAYVSTGKTTNLIVDCTYVRLAISCGLPFLIASLVLTGIASFRACSDKQFFLAFIIAAIALAGTMEAHCTQMLFNAFLFPLGSVFCCPAKKGPSASLLE